MIHIDLYFDQRNSTIYQVEVFSTYELRMGDIVLFTTEVIIYQSKQDAIKWKSLIALLNTLPKSAIFNDPCTIFAPLQKNRLFTLQVCSKKVEKDVCHGQKSLYWG